MTKVQRSADASLLPSYDIRPIQGRFRPKVPYCRRRPVPIIGTEDAFRIPFDNNKEDLPMWTKPAYTDLRIGFEVTMYFANR